MESDDEVKGQGNSYDFGARILDPRIGRWLSRDPHEAKYPNLSPYNYSENSPVFLNDPDGKDAVITITENTITVSAKIYVMNSGENKINVAEAQNSINNYWGKEQTYTDENGKVYNVKFDIQVIEATGNEDRKDASKNWVKPKDGSFRSNVKGYRYGSWAKGKKDKTYAHEVGHFLGLADQYSDVEFDAGELDFGRNNGTIESWNYESTAPDELMGTGKGYEGKEKVSQKDIDAIAKYALDRAKNGKFLNGKIILDGRRLAEDGYKDGLAAPTTTDKWNLSEKAAKFKRKLVAPHKENAE